MAEVFAACQELMWLFSDMKSGELQENWVAIFSQQQLNTQKIQ